MGFFIGLVYFVLFSLSRCQLSENDTSLLQWKLEEDLLSTLTLVVLKRLQEQGLVTENSSKGVQDQKLENNSFIYLNKSEEITDNAYEVNNFGLNDTLGAIEEMNEHNKLFEMLQDKDITLSETLQDECITKLVNDTDLLKDDPICAKYDNVSDWDLVKQQVKSDFALLAALVPKPIKILLSKHATKLLIGASGTLAPMVAVARKGLLLTGRSLICLGNRLVSLGSEHQIDTC